MKQLTFTLTPTFYDDTDHCGCFRDEPTVTKRTKREIVVTMSLRDAAELYNRADSYVDGAADYIADGSGGWVTAARATIRRMDAQGYTLDDYRAGLDAMRAEVATPPPDPDAPTFARGSHGATVQVAGVDHHYNLEGIGDTWRAAPFEDKYTCGPLMRRGTTWEEAVWASHLAAMEVAA